MCSLLKSVSRAIIVVLSTSILRVSVVLWCCEVWYFGPPCCRCIVRRRDRVVVVNPIYIRVILALALANRALVLVYQVGLLERWGWGGLIVFHNERCGGWVFVVDDEF